MYIHIWPGQLKKIMWPESDFARPRQAETHKKERGVSWLASTLVAWSVQHICTYVSMYNTLQRTATQWRTTRQRKGCFLTRMMYTACMVSAIYICTYVNMCHTLQRTAEPVLHKCTYAFICTYMYACIYIYALYINIQCQGGEGFGKMAHTVSGLNQVQEKCI